MTDRTPTTAAGRALAEGHGHRLVSDPLEDDVWCAADDEPWPCPFVQNLALIEAEARAPLREALLDAFREAKARIAVSHEAPPARASLDVERLRAAAQAVVDWSSDPHHRLDPGTESRVNALRAALEEPTP